MYDVIIIGSGPAGLMAGVKLKSELKVLILEKNEQLGKKLLVSGNGQCNFTHSGSIIEFFPKYNNEGRFIKRSLSLFTNEDLIQWSKKEKNMLNEALHELKFIIDSLGDVNESMVTCGGVSFKDVCSKTLQSRKISKLYFAGEVLDVDGESGGYNIQAAFSMGHLVTDKINKIF